MGIYINKFGITFITKNINCIGLDLSLIIWGFYELYGNNLCEE